MTLTRRGKLTLYYIGALLIFALTIHSAMAAVTDGLEIYLNLTGTYNDSIGIRTNGTIYQGTPFFQTGIIGSSTITVACVAGANNFRIVGSALTNTFARGGTQGYTECLWMNTSDNTFNNVMWAHQAGPNTQGFYARRESGATLPLTQLWAGSVNVNFPLGGGQPSGFQLFCTRGNASHVKNSVNATNGTATAHTVTATEGDIGFGWMPNGGTISNACYAGYAVWNRSITDIELAEVYNSGNFFDLVSGSGGSPPAEDPIDTSITIVDTMSNRPITNSTRIRVYNSTYQAEGNTTTGNFTFQNMSNSSFGLYTINFTSTGYFNRSIQFNRTNSTASFQNWQAVVYFSATDLGLNQLVQNLTATIQYGNMSFTNRSPLLVQAGTTFNITIHSPDHNNLSNCGPFPECSYTAQQVDIWRPFRFNVSANSTSSNLNVTVGNMTQSIVRIQVYNLSQTVQGNFSVLVVSQDSRFNYTWTYNATNRENLLQYMNISLSNTTWRIRVDGRAANLSTLEQNVTLAIGLTQLNFTLLSTNTINVTFFDEVTGLNLVPSAGAPIIFEGFSPLGSFNETITSGATQQIEFIIPNEYHLRFRQETNYSTRSYWFNLSDGTFESLSLYLLRNDQATNITVLVQDETFKPIEKARVTLSRFYLNTNTFRIMQIEETDFEGNAQFRAQVLAEEYRWTVATNATTRLITVPAMIRSTTYTLTVTLGEQLGTDFHRTRTIDHTLSFLNVSRQFEMVYNDVSNTISRACLQVYRSTTIGDTLHNSTCNDAVTGTIRLVVPEINGTIFKAVSLVRFTDAIGSNYTLDTRMHQFRTNTPFTQISPFLYGLLTMIMASIAYFNPVIALIITPLPQLMGAISGSLNITIEVALMILVICWMGAWYLSDRA